MQFEFDLQNFAEEENIADTADNTSQGEEEKKEEIPEELEGVSEEIARDVMEQAKAQAEEKEQTEEGNEDTASGESDNIPDSSFVKEGKVPYVRFKEQVDKTNELKAQIEAYRNRFGDVNAPIQQQIQPQQIGQQPQPTQAISQQQPVNFSPDVTKRIEEAVKVRAKLLSGLTDEDIESLEYMDDGDDRIARWKNATKYAETEIYSAIRQAQEDRVRAAKAFVEEHQRNVQSFNEYVANEEKNPDFKAISEYAVDLNGFAARLNDREKIILQSAYERTQRQTASPQDYYIVRNFYEQAKADYYNKKGARTKPAATTPRPHPRSENITGASTPGGITAEELRTMLNTQEWEQIPQKYKDMMLGFN